MAKPMPAQPENQEPTFRGVLTGSGATPLAFARWELPAPRGRVVIAHGYGEHGERYGHTARWLNGQGWSVSTLDHRGFGRSGGTRGDALGIRASAEDLALFLHQERMHDAERIGIPPATGGDFAPQPPACPQILLGHSFGGLVALLVLLWHPDTLEGLILSSPAIVLRPLPAGLSLLRRALQWLAPHHALNIPGDKAQVCSDPAMVQRYREDPLCHRFISAAFLAAMDEGRAELLGFGGELDHPILLLEAGQDTVSDPEGAEALWSAIRSGRLERHRLDGFFHEIFHDLHRAEAEQLTAQWLDRLFPAGERVPAQPSAMN